MIMTNVDHLGNEMLIAGYMIEGQLTEVEAKLLQKNVIKEIRMNMADLKPAVWTYPNSDGVGQTIIQPFIESFCAIDSWTEQNHFYLIICSCKPFHWLRLIRYLHAKGFHVLAADSMRLFRHHPNRKRWWQFWRT